MKPADPAAGRAAGDAIVLRDVMTEHRTRAGVVRALDPVSLDVEAGSRVAVMGPSGCGKSTLLGILAGLVLPTAGTVVIGGLTISDLDERGRLRFRRQRLGVVYQADNLLPHLTVEENVGLQLAIGDNHRDDAPRPTAQILSRLGIASLARRLPDELSGGQRQRASVARAVVHRPEVILADEPTGSLDEIAAQAVIDVLLEAQRAIGATLVVVTHDRAVAGQLDWTVHLERPTGDPVRAGSVRSR